METLILSDEAAQLVAHLEIHHPYGLVGPLPWMNGQQGIEYGAIPNPRQLLELSSQLRTFTEATSDVDAVRGAISNARRIVFLGFAFHRLNVDLLFPGVIPGTPAKTESVFATAVSLSQSDCGVIANELVKKALHPRESVFLRNDLTCASLFREYRLLLSLS